MMRSFFCVAAISAAVSCATAEGLSAAECALQHTTAVQGCDAVSAFAKCLASVPMSDPNRASTEQVLATVTATTPGCDITVAPSFTVVNRELRVVTQEDVRFSRFKRDDVGVFELKSMIEANTNQIAAAKSLITEASDANAVSAALTSTALDVKLATAADATVKSIAEIEAKVVAAGLITDAAFAKLQKQKEEADAEAAAQVEIAASWQFVANPILPTNRAAEIRVVGANFGQYDYSPETAPFFNCKYTLSTDSTTTISTAGIVKSDSEMVVLCPSPTEIKVKTTFKLTLEWLGRSEAVKIPFNGAEKKDLITFDMTWTLITQRDDTHVIVDVDGLDVDTAYTCKFTQKSIVKSSEGKFLDDRGRKLDCGGQPTGFYISDENTATVTFELFVKGTKTMVSYAGPRGESILVFQTCKNGIKDGTETDKDCGGGCSGCGANSVCKVTSDCEGGLPCKNGKCGLDGKTAKTAGKTCKAIKLAVAASKNGIYYVTGPNGEYKSSPKRVFCWQSDRDGGGWTLGMKGHYGQDHSIPRSGQGARGNVDQDVLRNLGPRYKLDDREIRTYLGQPNPTNDDQNAGKKTFSFMYDQSHRHTHYSTTNREYIISKNYKARWFNRHWTAIPESETKHEMTSYYMKSTFDGRNTQGEGTLNWRGQPRCGHWSGSGIVCNGMHSSNNPNGGHNCKVNIGRHWSGTINFKMFETNWDNYAFVCNGAQHTSTNQFSRRVWFRTSDDNKEY